MTPFSLRTIEEIISTYPEWSSFISEETYEGGEPYLVVVVPPPDEAGTHLPLRISTWDDEVTVSFDYYHTHFDEWGPEKSGDELSSARQFVRAVLNEEVAVASWWQGEACKICSQFQQGHSLKPPFKVSYTKVRVRSWRGFHNADHGA